MSLYNHTTNDQAHLRRVVARSYQNLSLQARTMPWFGEEQCEQDPCPHQRRHALMLGVAAVFHKIRPSTLSSRRFVAASSLEISGMLLSPRPALCIPR